MIPPYFNLFNEAASSSHSRDYFDHITHAFCGVTLPGSNELSSKYSVIWTVSGVNLRDAS